MYIKTANGWEPLWILSAPSKPEHAGLGMTAEARLDFEREEQFKLFDTRIIFDHTPVEKRAVFAPTATQNVGHTNDAWF